MNIPLSIEIQLAKRGVVMMIVNLTDLSENKRVEPHDNISKYKERHIRDSCLSHVKTQRESSHLQAGALTLNFPAYITVRNKQLLFNPACSLPICTPNDRGIAPFVQGINTTHSLVEALTTLQWAPTFARKYCVLNIFIPFLILLSLSKHHLPLTSLIYLLIFRPSTFS